MNILRTPDERFANLEGFPYAPHYLEADGLRMHYADEGKGETVLCLHGEPSWSYLYRKMIRAMAPHCRVIAPDLIGFGRSDKPDDRAFYTYGMHRKALERFIEALDLRGATLVCQDWGGLLGLPLALERPDRFGRLVVMNTGLPTGDEPPTPGFMAWRNAAAKMQDMDVGRVIQGGCASKLAPEAVAAYNAPFPDVTYKAGAMQFPMLVPISPDMEASATLRKARGLVKEWRGPALVMFSDKDPVTAGGDRSFRKNLPTARDEPEITIRDAGHFLQEDKGEEIAGHILEFIARRPLR